MVQASRKSRVAEAWIFEEYQNNHTDRYEDDERCRVDPRRFRGEERCDDRSLRNPVRFSQLRHEVVVY